MIQWHIIFETPLKTLTRVWYTFCGKVRVGCPCILRTWIVLKRWSSPCDMRLLACCRTLWNAKEILTTINVPKFGEIQLFRLFGEKFTFCIIGSEIKQCHFYNFVCFKEIANFRNFFDFLWKWSGTARPLDDTQKLILFGLCFNSVSHAMCFMGKLNQLEMFEGPD